MKEIRLFLCVVFLFAFGIVYELSQEPDCFFFCNPILKHFLRPNDVMSQGRSIIFLETTDHLQPSPLVLCSVESAARVYPDRPIIFFMKGLDSNTLQDIKSSYPSLFFLSTMKNVFLFPLQEDILFQDTPLLSWYLQVRWEVGVFFWIARENNNINSSSPVLLTLLLLLHLSGKKPLLWDLCLTPATFT